MSKTRTFKHYLREFTSTLTSVFGDTETKSCKSFKIPNNITKICLWPTTLAPRQLDYSYKSHKHRDLSFTDLFVQLDDCDSLTSRGSFNYSICDGDSVIKNNNMNRDTQNMDSSRIHDATHDGNGSKSGQTTELPDNIDMRET